MYLLPTLHTYIHTPSCVLRVKGGESKKADPDSKTHKRSPLLGHGSRGWGVGDECTGMLGPLCGLWVRRWKFSGQVTSCFSAKPFQLFSFPHAYRPWSSLSCGWQRSTHHQHTILPGSKQEVKACMFPLLGVTVCHCR